MRDVSGRRARSLWLTLRHVDPNPDRPGDTKYRDEDVDRDDDHPTARSGVAVDCVARVEPTNEEHCNTESKATVNGAGTTAPFVRKEKSRDGETKYNNCGDTRSKEGSF